MFAGCVVAAEEAPFTDLTPYMPGGTAAAGVGVWTIEDVAAALMLADNQVIKCGFACM
jgi:hypothetical protein